LGRSGLHLPWGGPETRNRDQKPRPETETRNLDQKPRPETLFYFIYIGEV
jgi:hypothetical protein